MIIPRSLADRCRVAFDTQSLASGEALRLVRWVFAHPATGLAEVLRTGEI
jgi:hypothetical protein